MLLRVTQKVVGVYCKVIIVINITVTVCLSPESRHISLQECGVTVAKVQSARKDFSIIGTNRNMRLQQKGKRNKEEKMVEGKELMCTVDPHLSDCNVIRSMAK